MIIYFSATGNNKYVAERIAAATGDELVSISERVKSRDYDIEIQEGEALGLVTPTYFWGLPSIVTDFIREMKITASGDNYVYHVLTYGTSTGKANKDMKKLLAGKGIELQGMYSVKMVDTWTPMFDLSDPEKNERDTLAAEPEIDAVIERVKARSAGDFNNAKGAAIIASMVHKEYDKKRSTALFTLSDACNGCGLCAAQCPLQAIELREERPAWVIDKCTLCFGCLHRCPENAIQYAGKTEGRGQFVNPNVKL